MKGLELALSVLREEAWLPTPLLPAATIGCRLGVELWLKREDCTPVGSFKIRGALVAMSSLGHQITETGVYVASAGNYGLAIAFAGQRHNVKVTVAVPENATPSKMERIRMCGAELIQYGNDFDAAKGYARAIAAKAGAPFWEDGVIGEMAFGAATIAAELLTHTDRWDYVLVPVGNGSLMKGHSQRVQGAKPSYHHSWPGFQRRALDGIRYQGSALGRKREREHDRRRTLGARAHRQNG